jgi:hypothetical protein
MYPGDVDVARSGDVVDGADLAGPAGLLRAQAAAGQLYVHRLALGQLPAAAIIYTYIHIYTYKTIYIYIYQTIYINIYCLTNVQYIYIYIYISTALRQQRAGKMKGIPLQEK